MEELEWIYEAINNLDKLIANELADRTPAASKRMDTYKAAIRALHSRWEEIELEQIRREEAL